MAYAPDGVGLATAGLDKLGLVWGEGGKNTKLEGHKKVRLDEERSDELLTLALGTKITHAMPSCKTHPLPNYCNDSHPSPQPFSRFASLIAEALQDRLAPFG